MWMRWRGKLWGDGNGGRVDVSDGRGKRIVNMVGRIGL